MKPVELNQEELKEKFGTTDLEKIFEIKKGESQEKSFSRKSSRVEMSVAECKQLCKAAGLEYLDGYEARVIEHTISDETVDRDGDILRAKGADLKNYLKNPAILFAHDYREFPIGNSIKVWIDEGGKKVKSYGLYFDDRVDPSGRADRAFKFINSGAMPACSVGFGPLEVNRPNQEERKKLGLGPYGVEYKRWELREYSACPVPANPNALRGMIKSGELNKKDCNAIIEDGLVSDSDMKDVMATIEEVFGEKSEENQPETPKKEDDSQTSKTSENEEKLIGVLVELNENIKALNTNIEKNNQTEALKAVSEIFESPEESSGEDKEAEKGLYAMFDEEDN